jgi:tetratricopeptide (TPR) repeat protein
LNNLGGVMLALHRLSEAERLFRQALRIRPRYADAMGNLGTVLQLDGRPDEAVDVLRQALEVRPDSAAWLKNLGNALRAEGRHADALAAYRRASAHSGPTADLLVAEGAVLGERGRHDAARAKFDRALSLDPDSVPALCASVAACQIRYGDALIERFRRVAKKLGRFPPQHRIDFLFAWGKLHQDLERYEEAFLCFAKANELKRSRTAYDRSAVERERDALRTRVSAERLAAWRNNASPSDKPVLIVGMPRSGTTLTEQIIGSHPRVAAAGELSLLGDLVAEAVADAPASGVFDRIDGLEPCSLSAIRDGYLAGLDGRGPEADRVTDKMPGNFWHVGLVKSLFPHARVVHVRRDPVDTLLSCFQQNFGKGQAFSNSLEDAAHYYAVYRDVMAHWRLLFGASLVEVDYERLVCDPETASRGLLDALGLDWHPACLVPHRLDREVRTASHWQVRQPVHASSVARWRHYQKQLAPLLDALADHGIGPLAQASGTQPTVPAGQSLTVDGPRSAAGGFDAIESISGFS